MEFTVGQESVFKIFDEIINNEGSVWEEVMTNESLRRRISRNFTSVGGRSKTRSALFLYGFIDFEYIPSPEELRRCWDVRNHSILLNKKCFNELLAVSNLSEVDLMEEVEKYKEEAVFELISNIISSKSPENVKRGILKNKYPFIETVIREKFKTIYNFRKTFGVEDNLPWYHTPVGDFHLIALGLEFEGLLENYIFPDFHSQYVYKDSRPDFVKGDLWVDAKLSKSTALDPRDDTISKYLTHTNNLLIVYALEDDSNISEIEQDGRISFKHVSEFYGNMSREALAEMEEFIKRASLVKRKLL